MEEGDFDAYDPTPYSGGYDQVAFYGRSKSASHQGCYPISTNSHSHSQDQPPSYYAPATSNPYHQPHHEFKDKAEEEEEEEEEDEEVAAHPQFDQSCVQQLEIQHDDHDHHHEPSLSLNSEDHESYGHTKHKKHEKKHEKKHRKHHKHGSDNDSSDSDD